MPELRLAKARSGYDGYVYQPPQSRTVQAVSAKWRAKYEPMISAEALAVCERQQSSFIAALKKAGYGNVR